MKANVARDLLYEISFFNHQKNEISNLLNSFSKDIDTFKSSKNIGISFDFSKILLKKNQLVKKLNDIEHIIPKESKNEIKNTRSNIVEFANNIPRLAIASLTDDVSILDNLKSRLLLLSETLNRIFEHQIKSRIDIPNYQEIKHIQKRLRYYNENPVFTCQSLQVYRRLWHLLGGVAIALPYFFIDISRGITLYILGVVALIVIPFDYGRLKIKSLNDRIIRDFKWLIRDKECTKISSMTHFLLGSILSILIFPKIVAVTCILFLAFGDPIASIIGIRFGRNKILWGKSMEGFIACFITCFFISYFVFSTLTISYESLFFFAVVSGLTGGIAEVLPLKYDDNLIIPLLSGSVISGLYFVMF